MRFEEFERRLGEGIRRGLPGPAAQAAMAPRPRAFWVPGEVPDSARPAAGLALVFPRRDDATILLTVRAARLANHRSQVSLPGGAIEAGESAEDAALREAEEEIGVERTAPRPAARLTPLHIPASGYVLQPVVATLPVLPAVRPDPREVDRVLEAPLGGLASGERLRVERRERSGRIVEVPYFDVDGEKLWGATAMIVAELLALLGAPVDPWRRPHGV